MPLSACSSSWNAEASWLTFHHSASRPPLRSTRRHSTRRSGETDPVPGLGEGHEVDGTRTGRQRLRAAEGGWLLRGDGPEHRGHGKTRVHRDHARPSRCEGPGRDARARADVEHPATVEASGDALERVEQAVGVSRAPVLVARGDRVEDRPRVKAQSIDAAHASTPRRCVRVIGSRRTRLGATARRRRRRRPGLGARRVE